MICGRCIPALGDEGVCAASSCSVVTGHRSVTQAVSIRCGRLLWLLQTLLCMLRYALPCLLQCAALSTLLTLPCLAYLSYPPTHHHLTLLVCLTPNSLPSSFLSFLASPTTATIVLELHDPATLITSHILKPSSRAFFHPLVHFPALLCQASIDIRSR